MKYKKVHFDFFYVLSQMQGLSKEVILIHIFYQYTYALKLAFPNLLRLYYYFYYYYTETRPTKCSCLSSHLIIQSYNGC